MQRLDQRLIRGVPLTWAARPGDESAERPFIRPIVLAAAPTRDPRFAALMRRMRAEWEGFEAEVTRSGPA